jgi:hypothetical protein
MKEQERIDKAVEVAFSYGLIDGDHHKMWVIDQMLRALLGKDYKKTVKKNRLEDDPADYWDTGIPP